MHSNKNNKLLPTEAVAEQISAEGPAIPPEEFQKVLESAESEDLNTTTATADPIKPEQRIYCGPNLPRGLLNQFTVTQNGLPAHVSKHIEECLAISRLCVPVDDFAKTEQAIQQAGSAEHVWYQQIVQYAQGGAKV